MRTSDPSSEVFQYNLKIFNETNVLGSTQTVVSETFNTPTFNYNIIYEAMKRIVILSTQMHLRVLILSSL